MVDDLLTDPEKSDAELLRVSYINGIWFKSLFAQRCV